MQARPRVGVLALQGDVREHSEAIEAAGGTAAPVRRPAELGSVSALVLPGGESTTMERLLKLFGLWEPLRERIGAGLPVLGTCAGMILLADRLVDPAVDGSGRVQETLGGLPIAVRRNAYGRQVDSFETLLPLTLNGRESVADAVFIRAPGIEELADGVEVLASWDGRPVAVRQGALMATAFHPETAGDTRLHAELLRLAQGAA